MALNRLLARITSPSQLCSLYNYDSSSVGTQWNPTIKNYIFFLIQSQMHKQFFDFNANIKLNKKTKTDYIHKAGIDQEKKTDSAINYVPL